MASAGGRGRGEPLRGSEIFPPLVTRMLAVGEETGAIDKMLVRVARYYDQDVDYTIKNLSTAIEPILLLVLGAAVLFPPLAVFLPLWDLMKAFRHYAVPDFAFKNGRSPAHLLGVKKPPSHQPPPGAGPALG